MKFRKGIGLVGIITVAVILILAALIIYGIAKKLPGG
jgi:hypothetical protein